VLYCRARFYVYFDLLRHSISICVFEVREVKGAPRFFKDRSDDLAKFVESQISLHGTGVLKEKRSED
jgi:hypothetical protein